jgi:hypothetical protein
VDVGTAIEMRATGPVQEEVVRFGVALAIDEVTVGMIVKPAEESAVVFLEDLTVLWVIDEHK